MIKPIKHHSFDCSDLAAELEKHGVTVERVEDLTGKVWHVGAGGATKSTYVSPKSGKTIFVLEKFGMYSADAYSCESYQFEEDFTVEQADEFLRAQRQE